MSNLNKVMLIGRVVAKPEIKTVPQDRSVVSYSVVTNRKWTDSTGQKQEQAEFTNITAWAKLAEICHQYLDKGKLVYIEGRLETDQWLDKETGQKRYKTKVVAHEMKMLDKVGQPQQPAEPETINLDEIPF